ncbi:prephenate dehydratase domain-containing protein [Candidatus Electronema sp. PJ]|uniref:prephenate dehydratase domain-containing protein n=1 Tax=Candidatus Electronema sp. PJ TaxID=3401572 RepID=UPI003AA809D5
MSDFQHHLTIGLPGPQHAHAWQAAALYNPAALLKAYPHTSDLLAAFAAGEIDQAVVPVYNTREGGSKQYFRLFSQIREGWWIDNVMLPVSLSLGVFAADVQVEELKTLIGRRAVFRQCEEYISKTFPDIALTSVADIDAAITHIRAQGRARFHGVIDSGEMLAAHDLHIAERELAPHSRTRYAVLGRALAKPTGYDATALVTGPLDDRVGLLVDILGEFARRGINILDMSSENDPQTQKLQIYLEAEGHSTDEAMAGAIAQIEERIVGQKNIVRLLGCFPRVDMRPRYIRAIGFIGTGDMSAWFAERLENEGYRVFMTGRSTELRPEAMIVDVDVVVICVPISVTAETIVQYGPLIPDGRALILLAGESESTLQAALEATGSGVEVMLVHNLWGPQAAAMKDKNAVVVRTRRSGRFCSEFEAFLYKHGASIHYDSATRHDLLMGIGQKLPTAVSVALAMTLADNQITADEIAGHCTLTSLYPILAMARVHSQHPRTYAEILSMSGESSKIVRDFVLNLERVTAMANKAEIQDLCGLIEQNRRHLTDRFLHNRMEQAKAVDQVLGTMI